MRLNYSTEYFRIDFMAFQCSSKISTQLRGGLMTCDGFHTFSVMQFIAILLDR